MREGYASPNDFQYDAGPAPLIPEHRHMKRPLRRLARGIIRMHLHLVRVLREPDGDQAGRHRLVQAAADGAGEIGLRLALQRPLPGDELAVLALQLAALDHVAPGDRAVGVDDARQSLFEFGHGVLSISDWRDAREFV